MNQQNLADFIWNVADSLRGNFKYPLFGRIILPAAVQEIVEAMNSHSMLATKLLSDEVTRGVFIDVVYDLLKRESGPGLFDAARGGR